VSSTANGLYRKTWRVCTACGARYRAKRITSRWCSTRCATQHGPWSFAANVAAGKGAS